jgi:hypothetical protein
MAILPFLIAITSDAASMGPRPLTPPQMIMGCERVSYLLASMYSSDKHPFSVTMCLGNLFVYFKCLL